MTPIQQLIRVATRNTPTDTGMWVAENISSLTQRERETLEKVWNTAIDSHNTGVSFFECYDSIIQEKFTKTTIKVMRINFPEAKRRVSQLVRQFYSDVINDFFLDINRGNPDYKLDHDVESVGFYIDVIKQTIEERNMCLKHIELDCNTISDLLNIASDEEKFGLFFEHDNLILKAILDNKETIEIEY